MGAATPSPEVLVCAEIPQQSARHIPHDDELDDAHRTLGNEEEKCAQFVRKKMQAKMD